VVLEKNADCDGLSTKGAKNPVTQQFAIGCGLGQAGFFSFVVTFSVSLLCGRQKRKIRQLFYYI